MKHETLAEENNAFRTTAHGMCAPTPDPAHYPRLSFVDGR
jgi:hypothetical protein